MKCVMDFLFAWIFGGDFDLRTSLTPDKSQKWRKVTFGGIGWESCGLEMCQKFRGQSF